MAERFAPKKLARILIKQFMDSVSGLTFCFSFFGVHRSCRMNASKVLNIATDEIV